MIEVVAAHLQVLLARLCVLIVAGLACLALAPSAAQAGRLVVTGHDIDFHCGGLFEQCHFVDVALRYVRAGSPNPGLPVLILDRPDLKVIRAFDATFGLGGVPHQIVDPRTEEFTSLPLDPGAFSAIFVASDLTCGGCDLNEVDSTPDSDAILARAGEITAFYNGGGGLIVGSGANHGDGNPATGADTYYSFLPLPAVGVAVTAPFRLTQAGRDFGLTDGSGGTSDDINCCETHNSFAQPEPGSALVVAETDSQNFAETLIADGTISERRFVAPRFVANDVIALPSSKKCLSKRSFPIRISAPRGVTIKDALVFVNGKKVDTVSGERLKAPVNLKGLPKGRYTVRIVVNSTSGRQIVSTRKYRTCAKKIKKKKKTTAKR